MTAKTGFSMLPLSRRKEHFLDDLVCSDEPEEKLLKIHNISRRQFRKWLTDDAFMDEFKAAKTAAARRTQLLAARWHGHLARVQPYPDPAHPAHVQPYPVPAWHGHLARVQPYPDPAHPAHVQPYPALTRNAHLVADIDPNIPASDEHDDYDDIDETPPAPTDDYESPPRPYTPEESALLAQLAAKKTEEKRQAEELRRAEQAEQIRQAEKERPAEGASTVYNRAKRGLTPDCSNPLSRLHHPTPITHTPPPPRASVRQYRS